MDNFEDQMEDRWIEKQIEDDEQEMHELIADLSEDQKKTYEAMSDKAQFVREHISILKSIINDYKYTGENK